MLQPLSRQPWELSEVRRPLLQERFSSLPHAAVHVKHEADRGLPQMLLHIMPAKCAQLQAALSLMPAQTP